MTRVYNYYKDRRDNDFLNVLDYSERWLFMAYLGKAILWTAQDFLLFVNSGIVDFAAAKTFGIAVWISKLLYILSYWKLLYN